MKSLIAKLKSNKFFLVISIVACVLVVAGIVIACSFVFPKSITGSWELTVNPEVEQSTADEVADGDRVYYVFEKPGRYGQGTWKTCYAGGVEYYEYKFVETESGEMINLGSVDLEYKITGSKLLGNAKVTLVYPGYTDEETGEVHEDEIYVLEQAKVPDYTKESYDSYNVDKALVGEWATNERTLAYYYYAISYLQNVEFTDDGIMIIHYESEDLMLDRYMYYAYTASDGQLTFSPVTDKDTKYTVGYEFDDKGNIKFLDDTTADSIFADEFFGEFTFYTPENLPEATEPDNESYFTEE